jgi:hypothetical protein
MLLRVVLNVLGVAFLLVGGCTGILWGGVTLSGYGGWLGAGLVGIGASGAIAGGWILYKAWRGRDMPYRGDLGWALLALGAGTVVLFWRMPILAVIAKDALPGKAGTLLLPGLGIVTMACGVAILIQVWRRRAAP